MSIMDVAQRAGVSYATVSRVINDRSGVAPATAERVRAVMKEMDYVPPPPDKRRGPTAAQHPGVKQGNLMFLWTSPADVLSSGVADALLQGATEAASRRGLNLIVERVVGGEGLPAAIEQGKVDGVLIHGAGPAPHLAERLHRVPVVWLLSGGPLDWGDRVQPDNEAIARLALDTLRERGHERIACITSRLPGDTPAYWQRTVMFRDRAEALGLAVEVLECHASERSDENMDDADAMVRRLLELDPQPTGIFVANDMLVRLHHAMLRHGIRQGKDLEVICCNRENLRSLGVMTSPLVISIEGEALARIAVEHVLWRLNNRESPQRMRILIAPRLVNSYAARITGSAVF